jgi:hypothetical protein
MASPDPIRGVDADYGVKDREAAAASNQLPAQAPSSAVRRERKRHAGYSSSRASPSSSLSPASIEDDDDENDGRPRLFIS